MYRHRSIPSRPQNPLKKFRVSYNCLSPRGGLCQQVRLSRIRCTFRNRSRFNPGRLPGVGPFLVIVNADNRELALICPQVGIRQGDPVFRQAGPRKEQVYRVTYVGESVEGYGLAKISFHINICCRSGGNDEAEKAENNTCHECGMNGKRVHNHHVLHNKLLAGL